MINTIIEEAVAVISYFILFLSYERLLKDRKAKIIRLLLLSLIISFLNLVVAYDVSLVIKLLISIISLYVVGPVVYNASWKEATSLTIIYFVLIMIGDIVVMLCISPFSSLGLKYVTSASLLKIGATLLCAVLIYLVMLNRKIANLFIKIIEFNNSKFNLFKNSVYLIVLMIVSLFLFIIKYFSNFSFLITILFSLSCIMLLIFTMYNIYRNTSLKIINDILIKNEKTYETIIENDKMFRHNIIHELNCIKAASGKKVQNIIDEYILEHTSLNNKYDKLINVPSGFKGIIYEKIVLHNFDENCLVVDNFIKSDLFKILSPKLIVKLCESFGIIIDNAIEASMSVSNPIIYIYLTENENAYFIKCINSFNNSIDVDNIGVENKTSKKSHFGVGLKYIFNKSTLDFESKIVNEKFICSIKVKK